MSDRPQVEIEFCMHCRFALRAFWLTRELMQAHQERIGALRLVPSSGGVFVVRVNGEPIFSRQEAERFPEPKELKELVAAKL